MSAYICGQQVYLSGPRPKNEHAKAVEDLFQYMRDLDMSIDCDKHIWIGGECVGNFHQLVVGSPVCPDDK